MDDFTLSRRWRSRFSLFWANGGDVSLALLVLSLVIAGYSAPHLVRGVSLLSSGVEVTGQVVSLSRVEAPCSENLNCVRLFAQVRYQAAGMSQGGVDEVRPATFAGLRQGGPVTLRYLPDEPAVPELEAATLLVHSGLGAAMSLMFLSVAVFLLRYSVRLSSRLNLLRRTGVRRKAVVTVHRSSRVGNSVDPETEDGEVSPWVAGWLDETGQGGESVAQSQFSLPPVGSTITIYADPSGKLPPVWEGDCGKRYGVGDYGGLR